MCVYLVCPDRSNFFYRHIFRSFVICTNVYLWELGADDSALMQASIELTALAAQSLFASERKREILRVDRIDK